MQALQAYIPIDRRQALAGGSAMPNRVQGAALFADIVGFTPLTEALLAALGPRRGAEVLPQHLNEVYDTLINEVDAFGGSVIGFSGDALSCWFEGDDGTKASACALRMQAQMNQFATISLPGGGAVTLQLKVAVASGAARRFLVGDPDIQLIDVVAGEAFARVATAEQLAHQGEVVLDEHTAASLGGRLELATWRTDANGRRVAVVAGTASPASPTPLNPLPPLTDEQLRPWLLPIVYERLRSGGGEFLTELRPAVALFLRFGGIDYDGDDSAVEKLDAYVRWVQKVLARFEGSLIQLTFGDKGSYLYAAFGAPIAHEDEVLRAANAALELRAPPPELHYITEMHFGLSYGTMRTGAYGGQTRRTYGVLGDEVNVAARLMSQAAMGQIVASERVYMATRNDLSWAPLGSVQVKGKRKPLAIYELLAAQAPEIGLQEPTYSLPMVGRASELRRIAKIMREVLTGAGRIVGISADAGMGKSRLVAEVLRLAQSHDLAIYGGTCQSYGTTTPYLVWQPIWRAFFGLPPEASAAEATETLEATLAEIAPVLLPRVPLLSAILKLPLADNELTRDLEPKLRKASLEALLVDCLRSRSSEPLMLILEDLHWVDLLSADLLEAVGRAIAGLPVLVILAYRPLEQPLGVAALPHFEEVGLRDFTPVESERLIALKLEQAGVAESMPTELVAALSERAQGNPFYLEELFNFLRERNIDPLDPSAWRDIELPNSLHSLILSRIDSLAERLKVTLKVASVIGRVVRMVWLLGYYPALGPLATVKEDFDALEHRELALLDTPEPELTYLFKHVVTQEVAYESLTYATRATLHEALAQFLEGHLDVERNLDLLAHHYDRSENLAKKRTYLARAGEAAQSAYANEAAIDYYQRLVALLAEDKQAEVLLRLGQVQELAGAWEHAEASYLSAEALADDTLAWARCRVALGMLWGRRGDFDRAFVYLERAKEQLHDLAETPEVLAASVETLSAIGSVRRQRGDYVMARTAFEGSLLQARALEDKALIATALAGLGSVAVQVGSYEVAEAHLQESLALTRELGSKSQVATTLSDLGAAASLRGAVPDARRYFEEMLALRREMGDKGGIAAALNHLAIVARQQKDNTLAQRLNEESLALQRELGNKRGMARSLSNLGLVFTDQGNYQEAIRLFEESLAIFRDVGEKPLVAGTLGNLGHVAFRSRDYASAQHYFEACLEIADALGEKHTTGMTLNYLGLVATEQGNFERAQRRFRESLTVAFEAGHLGAVHSLLVTLASLAVRDGVVGAARSVRLAAAATLQESYVLDQEDRQKLDRSLAEARALLDEATFRKAWVEGKGMTIEVAVAYALEDAGFKDEVT